MTGPAKRQWIASLLRERITSGLHLGLLAPGDRLPSSRRLHASLRVDARVVAAAYRELASDGLVELRPRGGARIAEVRGSDGSPGKAWVVELLLQAIERDTALTEVARQLTVLVGTRRLRAVCIECNADQLYSLGDELERFYPITPVLTELEQIERGDHRADLEAADLLVTTSFHAAPVRRLGACLGKPWIAVSLRPDVMSRMTARLSEGPVYFIGTDPRFGDKVVELGRGLGFPGNALPIILGRDPLDQIPAEAPLVVMSRAVPLLEGTAFLARARPPTRIFALESARQLLDIIVATNGEARAAASTGFRPAPRGKE